MKVYRIRNWAQYYENNRTRGMKEMRWVPIPINLSSDGYTLIMDQKDGPAIFGAFIACVELAGSCRERGTLMRSSGDPHDIDSLARVTRVDKKTISNMLNFCTEKCKWLEYIDLETGASIAQEGAVLMQEGALNRREGKGREGNRKEGKPLIIPQGNWGDDFNKSFLDFMDYRKEKKKAMSQRSIILMVAELNKISGGDENCAIEILNQSIMNGWSGIFPIKSENKSRSGKRQIPTKEIMESTAKMMAGLE